MLRSRGLPVYLFEDWSRIDNLLRQAKRIFLFLDYDGTLTPIVERPERAVISNEMLSILKSFAATPEHKLAIVSGRPLYEVINLVGLKDIYYVGNHGLEIHGPDAGLIHPEAKRLSETVSQVCSKLRSNLRAIEGVMVEDKGLSASIHYRMAPPKEVPEAHRILRHVMTMVKGLRIHHGKKVFEIRPDIEWNKGKAVKWLLSRVGQSFLPIYVGDDLSDEDAFREVDSGVTILVSQRKRRSYAHYYVRNVSEVQIFIRRLMNTRCLRGNRP